MKKLFLSLASVTMLAGLGAAYAGEPTTLDAATLDGITAAGSQEREHRSKGKNGGDRTFQNNQSFLSPQVNVGTNIGVLSHQENNQSNFNGNISR